MNQRLFKYFTMSDNHACPFFLRRYSFYLPKLFSRQTSSIGQSEPKAINLLGMQKNERSVENSPSQVLHLSHVYRIEPSLPLQPCLESLTTAPVCWAVGSLIISWVVLGSFLQGSDILVPLSRDDQPSILNSLFFISQFKPQLFSFLASLPLLLSMP